MRKTRKSVSTKKEISQCKTLKEKQEDFIMLPTVDFCFKELMQNDNIRKNIIAALLNLPSSEVENTELMPTILRKESKDDKYGILDVRVKLKDGEQIDFEMQVEAFDCWANRSVYYLSKMYTSEIVFEIADVIEEVPTVCWCGKRAQCNTRYADGKIVRKGAQVMLGLNESYVALCRKHYKEGRLWEHDPGDIPGDNN